MNNGNIDNFDNLQDAILEKDNTGVWCCWLATTIKGTDIEKLQNAVIERDEIGDLCYRFAEYVEGADVDRLYNAVIKKDKDKIWRNKLRSY